MFRKRWFITVVVCILFISIALFIFAIISRRAEVAVVHTAKEFYIPWITESDNAKTLVIAEEYVTPIFRSMLAQDPTSGRKLFCGKGVPQKIVVRDASAFWHSGSASIILSYDDAIIPLVAQFRFMEDRWRINSLTCASPDTTVTNQITVSSDKIDTVKSKGKHGQLIPVQLYMYDQKRDGDVNGNPRCSSEGIVPVTRLIGSASGVSLITDTLRMLLEEKVNDSERSAGLMSEYPLVGVEIKDIALADGTLTIVITDPYKKTGAGACRVSIMRGQIEMTARQFPGVERVRFLPVELFQP
jgi:hypothetical protein